MQRVGVLFEIPGILREFGVRPIPVLRRLGLAPDSLADRDALIPYSFVGPLLEGCARVTKCDHFALLVGSRYRLDRLGLPGEIAASCATVGEAIERFVTFHWLNSSGGVAYLQRSGRTTGFGYAIYDAELESGHRHIFDLTIAAGACILRELSGNPEWAPREVLLSRVRPRDVRPYRRFFRASVRFDAEQSMLHFPSSFEALPVSGGDATRRRMLEAKLAAMDHQGMLPRMYRIIRVALLFGLTSGNDVAAAMALSRRTFNRRLAEVGTTFQHALDTVRFQVAQQLLRETQLSVTQIAGALGYSETTPFIRAFRRWSGHSPGRWRLATKAGSA